MTSPAINQRLNWLATISSKQKNVTLQHIDLLKIDKKTIVQNFIKHQQLLPKDLLKRGLERCCSSSEMFLSVKNKFIRQYATFCIAGYVLGIGDRHLDNYLVNTIDGEITAIDFGISFGSGIDLLIPELMPFRLTRVFEAITLPVGCGGILRQSMVYAFNALKINKRIILNVCQAFIRDPLIDWLSSSKNKSTSQQSIDDSMTKFREESYLYKKFLMYLINNLFYMENRINFYFMKFFQESQSNWYPNQRIEIVLMKLYGYHPVDINLKELKDSRHNGKVYYEQLCDVLKQNKKGDQIYMDTQNQVDALLQMAQDPNILGRTWIGWNPIL